MTLNISYSQEADDLLKLNVSGEINSANADEFASGVNEATESMPDFTKILFDLSDLEYISSAGLRVFLMIRKKCEDISIINAADCIHEIFDITGFTDYFKFV